MSIRLEINKNFKKNNSFRKNINSEVKEVSLFHSKIMNKQTVLTWTTWYDKTKQMKSIRNTCKKVTRRIQSLSVYKTWTRWTEYTNERKQYKRKVFEFSWNESSKLLAQNGAEELYKDFGLIFKKNLQ